MWVAGGAGAYGPLRRHWGPIREGFKLGMRHRIRVVGRAVEQDGPEPGKRCGKAAAQCGGSMAGLDPGEGGEMRAVPARFVPESR